MWMEHDEPATERPWLWLPPEPEIPDWVGAADPHARLQQTVAGLTSEHTFALAALTTYDEGSWRLAALTVSDDLPALRERIEAAALPGLSRRLDETPLFRAASPDCPPGPDLIIAQQLADLLDPIVVAGPLDPERPKLALRVWTSVPLWVGEQLLGALTAGAIQDELSEAQQELLQAFASQAILALANIALWERACAALRRSREAERRYHNLLESSADAIFLLDPHGRCTYVNRQAEALLGYSRGELLGRPFLELTSAEGWPDMQRIAQRIVAGEALPFTLELTLTTRSGRGAPVEISLTPLRSAGQLDGVEVVARDIRERLNHERERERLLHQKGCECETIVRNSADGIAVFDQEQRLVDCNPALERILGYTAAEILGRRCWDLFHPAGERVAPCNAECPYHDGKDGDAPRVFTHQFSRADGRLVTISITYGVVRDREGAIARLIATIRDVTRQAELERMRNDFVSSVSHELRTPLALIKGYVGTLLRPDISVSEEVRRRFLHNIAEASDRLSRLIDDLLTVSRAGAGKMSMDCRPRDLVALTREIVERASVQFPEHHIELSLPAEALRVRLDAGRIEQVLNNLLSNAVKYSPRHQPVRVKVERAGAQARVSVADSGPGIAPEHVEHLFEKFYRVENGALRQTPGLGLGLHIAKGIIDAHGGHIWVQSRLGAGSTFGFDLPLIPEGRA